MATKYDAMRPSDIRFEARQEAQRVLSNRWNGKLPVDPIKIAQDLGIEVYTAQLGEDVYGMITGTPSGATIYLDIDQPHVKMRFTAAHELGHFMERSERAVTDESEFAEIDRRSDSGHGKGIEVFANEFAGSLLMPDVEVRRLHAQGMDKLEMAKHFNVSLSAMGLRLFHLQLP